MNLEQTREAASKHGVNITKLYNELVDEYQKNGIQYNPQELRKNAEYLYILANLKDITQKRDKK